MYHPPINGTVQTVDTEQRHELGRRATFIDSTLGLQEWVYVFNDDATNAFAQGLAVIRDPSAATYDDFGAIIAPITTPAPALTVIGVAQHAIPVGSYGWVLRKGQGYVKAGSAEVTADTRVTTGGSAVGTVKNVVVDDTAADDTQHAAFAVVNAVIAAGAVGLAMINCPGA